MGIKIQSIFLEIRGILKLSAFLKKNYRENVIFKAEMVIFARETSFLK